ncbi:MAG: secondary thiamine-phosphate synthase enzyme YjbQ [Planctomycetota bacterium]
MHQQTITFPTTDREQIVDITDMVKAVAAEHPDCCLCALYARGATAAIMIQENCDPNIGKDVLACLDRAAPQGQWLHDRVDDNAAAHIKSGVVGPSETVPVRDGALLLSRWQNVCFCEFDGPRREREVVVTLI